MNEAQQLVCGSLLRSAAGLCQSTLMKLVLFGAGNIGRSFIAPLFVHSGYEVVFVDINERVITEINRRGEYPVVTVTSGSPPRREVITNVRAVDGRDEASVSGELATAALAATAVGKGALPAVARSLAAGVAAREKAGAGALDVILAENVRECAALVAEHAEATSPGTRERLGLVETSIGKMVPIVPPEESAKDPLIVYAEPYNTLIVDKLGFVGRVPQVENLEAVDRIDAYVDRKLFIHNLGHAATAYLGYAHSADLRLVAEAISIDEVEAEVRCAMGESTNGLLKRYPEVFRPEQLSEHVDDLVARFGNPALGDTLHRVGRDLPRKLGRDDRLVGAMRLCAQASLPFETIARAYYAALTFQAPDASGHPFAADAEVVRRAREEGLDWVLGEISGLSSESAEDRAVVEAIRRVARFPQAS